MSDVFTTNALELILKASKIAGTDQSRCTLTNVLINETEIKATDGHRLISLPHDLGFIKTRYLVQCDQFKALKMLVTNIKRNKMPAIPHTIDSEGLTVSFQNSSLTFIPEERYNYGKFPNLDAVIPKPGREELTFGINADYLASLQEALQDLGVKKDQPVMVSLPIAFKRSKEGAIESVEFNNAPIKVQGYELKKGPKRGFGLVMPCRL